METRNFQSESSAKDSNYCLFCNLDTSCIYAANELSLAILDGYPLSPGHTLIIPKRHFESLFEATEEERTAMFDLMAETRLRLIDERGPIGFNIGINDGTAAGQTVMHLHIHLIPRYAGDMPDPRGGVRWIFPDRAVYWVKEEKP
jgi:diadenosine tetraphosphate (Ap4A) HIT family hydrolase